MYRKKNVTDLEVAISLIAIFLFAIPPIWGWIELVMWQPKYTLLFTAFLTGSILLRAVAKGIFND